MGAATVVGDTFALPEPIDTEGVVVPETTMPSVASDVPPESREPSDAPAAHPARAPQRARPSSAAAGSSNVSGSPPELYGAVGDRSATDIALAFTSNFPAAASSDPLWQSAPYGSAGEVRMALTIDESGRLIDASLLPGGSPGLRSVVERTLALIRGRAFTAHQAKTTLSVSGKVSPDEVHDGLHGDFFAVGRSSHDGSAFFALPIGRRIDVRVQSK